MVATSASPGQPGALPGLAAALTAASLEGRIAAAVAWCDAEGARDLDELAEDDVFAQFAEALGLKNLEKRRLHRILLGQAPPPRPHRSFGALSASSGAGAASVAASLGLASPPRAAGLPGVAAGAGLGTAPFRSLHSGVFVKNTFLDLDDGVREASLKRSSTLPAGKVAAEAEGEEGGLAKVKEEEEEDQNEDDDDGVNDGEEPSELDAGSSPPMQSQPVGIYRVQTIDGYEPVDYWSWTEPPNNAPATSSVANEAAAAAASAVAPTGLAEPVAGAPFGYPDHLDPYNQMVMLPPFQMPVSPAMAGMYYPGLVAVPADRFARWPLQPGAGADGTPADGVSGNSLERPCVLQRAFSSASGKFRVRWTVDAKKLSSTDREAVSPAFDISSCGAGTVQFKLVVRPKVVENVKGGACFKRAKGKGHVQLRAIDADDKARVMVSFRLSVGSNSKGRFQEAPRGPILHDFAERPIAGLPEGQDDWDFKAAVDPRTQTFVVCLEVLTNPAGGSRV